MPPDLEKALLANRKYPFTPRDYIAHYRLPVILLLLPVFAVSDAVKNGEFQGFLTFLASISLIQAIIVFFYTGPEEQKFHIMKPAAGEHEYLYKMSKAIVTSLKWKIVGDGKDFIQAIREPGFSMGSMGQRITILIKDNTLYVNSLEYPSTAAMPWPGRNARNIRIFKSGVEYFTKNPAKLAALQP